MTPRQRLLLKAIIDEFIKTAEAVGSLNIPKKYKIDASPATIRNEMSRLAKMGYLAQAHISAGRIPTNIALKYYLDELLEEFEELDHQIMLQVKEDLYQKRFSKIEFIQNGLKALANLTNNTAIMLVDKNIYYAGLAEMLDLPEFQEMVHLKSLLRIMEDYMNLYEIFDKHRLDDDTKVLIGDETGLEGFEDYAVVFSPIKLYSRSLGYLGVIGPNRMNYSRVIPAVKMIVKDMEKVVKGW